MEPPPQIWGVPPRFLSLSSLGSGECQVFALRWEELPDVPLAALKLEGVGEFQGDSPCLCSAGLVPSWTVSVFSLESLARRAFCFGWVRL